jgi:hypothetical protein
MVAAPLWPHFEHRARRRNVSLGSFGPHLMTKGAIATSAKWLQYADDVQWSQSHLPGVLA